MATGTTGNTGSTGTWEPVLYLVGPTGSIGPTGTFSFSGVTGAILYSPDGVGVTGSGKLVYKEELVSVTSAIQGKLNGIAYGVEGGYVAVGSGTNLNTRYVTSSNAVSWTGGTGPIQGVLNGIAYGPTGGYVAVGSYDNLNTIYITSSNALSWTGGTGPIEGKLNGIAYDAAGGYVAVGYTELNGGLDSLFLTSADGLSWTGGTGPIPGSLNGIAYGPTGGYVAVGFDTNLPPNSIYLTSSNGLSWTGGTGPVQGSLYGITYDSAGGYVAVGADGINTIYLTSSNGETWTGGTGPIPGSLNGIAYGAAGGYVAVGDTQVNGGLDSLFLTSSNGVSWTGGTGPISGALSGITYEATYGYVAVGFKNENGTNYNIYLTSSDGQGWTGGGISAGSVEIPKSSITIDALIDNNGSTGAPGQVLTAGPVGAGLVWEDGVTNIYDTLYASTFTISTIGSTTGPITFTSDLYVTSTISTHSIVIYGSNTLVSEGSAFFSTLTSQEVVLPYNYTTSNNFAWTNQVTSCNAFTNFNWTSVASDSTGSNLAACVSGGDIWTGHNTGSEWVWTNQAINCNALSNLAWASITSDSTGSNLAAVAISGSIWAGVHNVDAWTWIDLSTTSESNAVISAKNWSSIASDSTGSNLVACIDSGGGGDRTIWTGHNTGSGWVWTDQGVNCNALLGDFWIDVASDSTGSNLVAVTPGSGNIWTGQNTGSGWVWTDQSLNCNALYPNDWLSITSDSTGSNLAAAAYNGTLWIGENAGAGWIWTDLGANGHVPIYASWYSIASDSTGSNLVAVQSSGGTLWTGHKDSGSWTWTNQALDCNVLAGQDWRSVTFDAIGSNIAGVGNAGVFWTGVSVPGVHSHTTNHTVKTTSNTLLYDGSVLPGILPAGGSQGDTLVKESSYVDYNMSWTPRNVFNTLYATTVSTSIIADTYGSTGAPGKVLTAGQTGGTVVWGDPTITIAGTAGSILYSGDGVAVTGSSKSFYGESSVATPVPIPGVLNAVTYGSPGGVIAVGYDSNTPRNTLYALNVGTGSWTSGIGPIQGELNAITYDVAGGFVAVGISGPDTIYLSSPDGVSWTGGTGVEGVLSGIAYGPTGGYVAVGNDYLGNSLIFSSSNGQSWTGTTGPIGGFLYGIAYGPTGGYVAVGNISQNNQDNTLYLTSSDGVSWTGDTGHIRGFLSGIAHGPTDGYVAVGYTQVNGPNETLYLTSPDGLSWTGNTGPVAGVLKGITYNASYGYVAVGYESTTGNSLYITSSDGVSWTGGTGPIVALMMGIVFSPYDSHYLGVGFKTINNSTNTAFISSGNGVAWTGSTELGSTGIMKSSISPDFLYDNLATLGSAGQVLTAGPAGGGLEWASAAIPTGGNTGYVITKASAANYDTLWSLPTMPMGKMIRVDSVYGDDLLGSPGTYAYQTVTAAVAAASNAGPGYTIWVMPGTYNLSNSITIPTGCALRGSSTQTTIIQMCNVTTAFTTLITMGENTRVEDLTFILESSDSNANHLVGIEFPGTTTVTGKVRTCVLTVNNSNVDTSANTTVYGIQATGTGTASFTFNSLKGSTVNIYSNGDGEKRGILVSASNTMTTRDMNIYVAAPPDSNSAGSYIGIETTNSNGKIQCRSTTISGYSSDIKQTQGSIELGPGVDIVNKTAGGCNFTSYVYPTILYYGVKGTLRGSGLTTSYLWPGTGSVDDGNGGNPIYPDSSVAYYRAQQKSVIIGMYATLACNAGVDQSATVTLQVNDSNTPFSLGFSNNTGPASNYFYDASVTLQRFDRISVRLDLNTVTSSNLAHDLSLQVDIF